MSALWWGIPTIILLGGTLVWYGWWSDRRATRRAVAEAARPTRALPGLDPEQANPAYVQEASVLAAPPAGPRGAESADAGALIRRRDASATLPGGVPDPSFLTRPEAGLAVLATPSVLVLDEDLDDEAAVTTILLAAARRGTPLVVAAPGFGAASLGTLRANARLGAQAVAPIRLSTQDALHRAAVLTGGRVVDRADVQSGWLPEDCWGTCAGWIADLDDSWIVEPEVPAGPEGSTET